MQRFKYGWQQVLVISLTFSLYSHFVMAEEFQQAYAPIAVGDITTIIPIDRQPEQAAYFSISESGENVLLEWESVYAATRYKLEYFKEGIWYSVSDTLTANKYTGSKANGIVYRVSACDIYGCSEWVNIKSQISDELMLDAFTKSSDAVVAGQAVTLSWVTKGSIRVSLTSNKGHSYDGYSLSGSHNFLINDVTEFVLTAHGFNQQFSQKLYVSPTKIVTDFETTPKEDAYQQPLLNLVKDVNSQLVPVERSFISVSSPQSQLKINLIALFDRRLINVDERGNVLWSVPTPGLVANRPIYMEDTDFIYFSASIENGTGQICRISASGSELSCLSHTVQGVVLPPLVGSPVFSRNQNKLYFIAVDGTLFEVADTFDSSTLLVLGAVPLAAGDSVISSPSLDETNNRLVVRTNKNQVVSISLPAVLSSYSRVFKSASAFFGLSSASEADTDTPELEIQWSADLSAQGAN